MILETLITTVNASKQAHIAPMGVHTDNDNFIILPFRPSATLDNLLETQTAVINYCDDVRIFSGCLTGRRDWPLEATKTIEGYYLQAALAHDELQVERIEDDPVRPKIFCRSVHKSNHKPFSGFNRAQFAVIEAAILVSRLNMLPDEKIRQELDYLTIGFEKTAGSKEREAWNWLMEVIEQHWEKSA